MNDWAGVAIVMVVAIFSAFVIWVDSNSNRRD